ncbi:MAG: hypothetical protein ACTSXG_00450 [Alphaproteobacteria bacterium]
MPRLMHFLKSVRCGQLIIALMLFIPFLNLPPFRFGPYHLFESVTSAFWLIGGIASIWLLIIFKEHPFLIKKTFEIPLVWWWFLISLISFSTGIFRANPLRIFTGTPSIAEGILTFLSMGTLSFVAIIVSSSIKAKKPIIFAFFVSAFGTILLSLLASKTSRFHIQGFECVKFFGFLDFLSYVIVSIPVAYFIFFKNRLPLFIHLLFGIFFIFLTFSCDNKSLEYSFAIYIPTIIFYFLFRCYLHRNILSHISFFGINISLTFFVIFYDYFVPYLPSFITNNLTFESRMFLANVPLLDLVKKSFWDFSDWLRILFGSGWGFFHKFVLGNLFLLKNFSLFNNTTWKPSWEFIDRDLLHTHNIWVETFCATGIFGVIALVIYASYLIRSVKKEHFFIAHFFFRFFWIQKIFWFQFVQTIPFTIFVHALVCRKPVIPFDISLNKIKRVLQITSVILIIWPLFHIFAVVDIKRLGYVEIYEDLEKVYGKSYTKYYEALIGGQRQIGYIKQITFTVLDRLRDSKIEKNEDPSLFVTSASNVAFALFNTTKSEFNPQAYIIPLNIYSELSQIQITKPYFFASKENLERWQKIATEFMEKFPYRIDVLIPLLTVLLEMENSDTLIVSFSRKTLLYDPLNPIASWFLGVTYLKNVETYNEGINLLSAALENKVDRYIPIGEEQKKQLLGVI